MLFDNNERGEATCVYEKVRSESSSHTPFLIFRSAFIFMASPVVNTIFLQTHCQQILAWIGKRGIRVTNGCVLWTCVASRSASE